jgi:MFS family permease
MGGLPVPADQAARAKRRILVATSLVTSLVMLNMSIVAVSLPSIARKLGVGFADIEWVISAYVLTFAALPRLPRRWRCSQCFWCGAPRRCRSLTLT